MTYRRLFRHLVILGTVLLFAAWGLSVYRVFQITCGWQECNVKYGSLFLIIRERPGIPLPPGASTFRFNYWLQRPAPPVSLWAGKWSHQRSYTEFPLAPGSTGQVPTAPVVRYLPNHTYQVPLWALWLVYLGVVFAFCRIMEKRSRSGREKELATGGSSGTIAGDLS